MTSATVGRRIPHASAGVLRTFSPPDDTHIQRVFAGKEVGYSKLYIGTALGSITG